MPVFPDDGPLHYQGQVVRLHPATQFICLTDLWRGEGAPAEKNPATWLRQGAVRWLQSPAKADPAAPATPAPAGATRAARVLEILEGEFSVVYADAEITLVYARYLSAKSYEWALETMTRSVPSSPAAAPASSTSPQVDLPSRRRLFKAGWAVPVVIALVLTPAKAYAHTDHTFSNGGHLDSPL